MLGDMQSEGQPLTKYGLNALKKKALIKPRNVTVEDLPSELSADEWGEIQRYGQVLHEE